MLQELLVPVVPRCSHMRSDSSSLDTSMVSYLASSRFGPAILTTYSQQVRLCSQKAEWNPFTSRPAYLTWFASTFTYFIIMGSPL